MVEGGGSKMFIQTKTWIYKYPEESKALLQKIAELCVEYLALQVQAGAQVCCPKQGRSGALTRVDDPSLRFLGG
jgi:uroporphyrinogen-III decarboxylase